MAEDDRGVVGSGVERDELDLLFSATYEELRRLAARVGGYGTAATLNPTALVNECWLKLAATPRVAAASPLHFRRIAARAMRQVLVEAARRRRAAKRGAGSVLFVTFDEELPAAACGDDVLRLDTALESLAQLSPRQAAMVEARFFGGLEVPDIARLLDISEATVLRDWRAARAWLSRALQERS